MAVRELDQDIFELQADALDILLYIGLAVCNVVFVVGLLGRSFFSPTLGLTMLLGPAVTAGILLLCFWLKRKQNVRAAAWLLIGGLIVGPVIGLILEGLSPILFLFFILPIIAASLLSSGTVALRVAVVCTVLLFSVALVYVGFKDAIGYSIVPGTIYILTGTFFYLNEGNTMRMVHWALDIQQKDNQRAEIFYKQKEELNEAVLELKKAQSSLEHLNMELKEAQQKTEQVSKAKSVFLSNMSHELRTPLNVVLGYTSSMLDMPQMYQNTPLPEVYRQDIQLIKDHGHYLLGLITDILDLSKIEAGKLELHPTKMDLVELFRGVIATSVGLAKDKPIQIKPDFPDTLPNVWADPIRVRQIVLNLMSNAIKFTPTGSVTLQARVLDDRVDIAVIDTGIGIPEKALPHIFDRFQQAEHDTDKHYGGTGLGLDISRRLARMHGGELSVTSVVGQGSTFSFALPIHRSQQAVDEGIPQETTSSVTMLVSDGEEIAIENLYTVLVVEDEVSMRDMIRRSLESAGHVVIDTDDGAEAQSMAVGLLPDLIILDVRLPNVNGWDILQKLKHDPQTASIPVILCTAVEDEERARELGTDMYLQKPFSTDQLLTCIQNLFPSTLQQGV
jgi:signal transduction histidine kinase/ActR/RegA family two-component response regulator